MSRKSIMSIACFFLLTTAAFSQKPVIGFSIEPEAGSYIGTHGNMGYEAGGGLNILVDRFILASEYQLSFGTYFTHEYYERFEQFNLLVGGFITDDEIGFNFDEELRFFLQAGVGFSQGHRTEKIFEDNYPDEEFNPMKLNDIGIPIKFGVKIVLTKVISLGSDFQIYFNNKHAIFMTTVNAELGLLK